MKGLKGLSMIMTEPIQKIVDYLGWTLSSSPQTADANGITIFALRQPVPVAIRPCARVHMLVGKNMIIVEPIKGEVYDFLLHSVFMHACL